jgi:hypothetical protein
VAGDSSRISSRCAYPRQLDLGDDRRLRAGELRDQPHVRRRAHERRGDEVDTQLAPEGEVAPVLLGDRRHAELGLGEGDALQVAEGARGDD